MLGKLPHPAPFHSPAKPINGPVGNGFGKLIRVEPPAPDVKLPHSRMSPPGNSAYPVPASNDAGLAKSVVASFVLASPIACVVVVGDPGRLTLVPIEGLGSVPERAPPRLPTPVAAAFAQLAPPVSGLVVLLSAVLIQARPGVKRDPTTAPFGYPPIKAWNAELYRIGPPAACHLLHCVI